MRVLVCGGRNYMDAWRVNKTLRGLHEGENPITIIMQGGATGADAHARAWADCFTKSITFAAYWRSHGKAAGPIRNQRMLDEGKPDLVVAFPGGKGTADMVRRARKAGVEVIDAALAEKETDG